MRVCVCVSVCDVSVRTPRLMMGDVFVEIVIGNVRHLIEYISMIESEVT